MTPPPSRYVDAALDLVARELTPRMAISEMGLVSSMLTLLSAITTAAADISDPEIASLRLERVFLVALAWSVGGTLEMDDRARFDKFLRGTSTVLPEPGVGGASAQDTIYSYMVSGTSAEWEHWGSRVPRWSPPHGHLGAAFASILVPTADSVCSQYIIDLSLSLARRNSDMP